MTKQTKLQPLGSRVIVKAEAKEEKTSSGIVIPDTASKEKPQQGKVIAIGPKQKQVKEGDIVIFKKYAPTEIKMGGEEFLILDREDILAVVK